VEVGPPVSPELWIAAIAALPPTLAAILGYLGNRRSIRRSLGNSPGVPLSKVVARLESKVDVLTEGQAAVRERLAHLEGQFKSFITKRVEQ
jgi:hypothetical protein